jgi:hypothetical protein
LVLNYAQDCMTWSFIDFGMTDIKGYVALTE